MNAQSAFTFDPPTPFKEELVEYLKTEIGNAAWHFDQANPHVYIYFASFARQALNRGRGRFGVGAIWERMRWELNFETDSDEPFKISNNHRAYYARRIMAENKDFEGFFITHEARQ